MKYQFEIGDLVERIKPHLAYPDKYPTGFRFTIDSILNESAHIDGSEDNHEFKNLKLVKDLNNDTDYIDKLNKLLLTFK